MSVRKGAFESRTAMPSLKMVREGRLRGLMKACLLLYGEAWIVVGTDMIVYV